jgi:hypothetical protein
MRMLIIGGMLALGSVVSLTSADASCSTGPPEGDLIRREIPVSAAGSERFGNWT